MRRRVGIETEPRAQSEELPAKPKKRVFHQLRPVRRDQLSVKLTSEERRTIEEMAVARGLNSGGSLLRVLFLAELRRERDGKQG